MGYSEDKCLGGTITSFQPDDTDTEFYIAYTDNLAAIYVRALQKWPEIKIDQIQVHAEYIQTDCLNYDHYDSSDYTNFLRIEKI